MKKTLFAFGIVMLISACVKTSDTPGTQNNLLTSSQAAKSNADFLVAHTWRYNKVYANYVNNSNPGTLVYDRVAGINTYNVGKDTVKYFSNGTYVLGTKTKTKTGTWMFTDSAQTIIQQKQGNSISSAKVKLLNKSHYNWLDFTEHVYAEMEPLP